MAFDWIEWFYGNLAALAAFANEFRFVEPVIALLFFGAVAVVTLGGEDGLHFVGVNALLLVDAGVASGRRRSGRIFDKLPNKFRGVFHQIFRAVRTTSTLEF